MIYLALPDLLHVAERTLGAGYAVRDYGPDPDRMRSAMHRTLPQQVRTSREMRAVSLWRPAGG